MEEIYTLKFIIKLVDKINKTVEKLLSSKWSDMKIYTCLKSINKDVASYIRSASSCLISLMLKWSSLAFLDFSIRWNLYVQAI